jgi:hypothetical protein
MSRSVAPCGLHKPAMSPSRDALVALSAPRKISRLRSQGPVERVCARTRDCTRVCASKNRGCVEAAARPLVLPLRLVTRFARSGHSAFVRLHLPDEPLQRGTKTQFFGHRKSVISPNFSLNCLGAVLADPSQRPLITSKVSAVMSFFPKNSIGLRNLAYHFNRPFQAPFLLRWRPSVASESLNGPAWRHI